MTPPETLTRIETGLSLDEFKESVRAVIETHPGISPELRSYMLPSVDRLTQIEPNPEAFTLSDLEHFDRRRSEIESEYSNRMSEPGIYYDGNFAADVEAWLSGDVSTTRATIESRFRRATEDEEPERLSGGQARLTQPERARTPVTMAATRGVTSGREDKTDERKTVHNVDEFSLEREEIPVGQGEQPLLDWGPITSRLLRLRADRASIQERILLERGLASKQFPPPELLDRADRIADVEQSPIVTKPEPREDTSDTKSPQPEETDYEQPPPIELHRSAGDNPPATNHRPGDHELAATEPDQSDWEVLVGGDGSDSETVSDDSSLGGGARLQPDSGLDYDPSTPELGTELSVIKENSSRDIVLWEFPEAEEPARIEASMEQTETYEQLTGQTGSDLEPRRRPGAGRLSDLSGRIHRGRGDHSNPALPVPGLESANRLEADPVLADPSLPLVDSLPGDSPDAGSEQPAGGRDRLVSDRGDLPSPRARTDGPGRHRRLVAGQRSVLSTRSQGRGRGQTDGGHHRDARLTQDQDSGFEGETARHFQLPDRSRGVGSLRTERARIEAAPQVSYATKEEALDLSSPGMLSAEILIPSGE